MRNGKQKGPYYRPDDRLARALAAWFVLAGAAAVIASFALALSFAGERRGRSANVAGYLCTTSGPCDVVLTLEYDSSPVDVVITSPSGAKRAMANMPTYVEDGKSATASFSTDEVGDWTAEYQPMSNRRLSLSAALSPPSRIFVSNLSFDMNPGSASISFRSDYGPSGSCSCLVRIGHGENVYTVYSGEVGLNTDTRIDLSMSGVPAMSGARLSMFLYPTDGPALDFTEDGMGLAGPSRDDVYVYSGDGFSYDIVG